jgi:uncharacterized membrane protein
MFMMKYTCLLAFALATLFLVQPAFALELKSFSAEYDVREEDAQVTLELSTYEEMSSFEWLLPQEATEISSDAKFSIKDLEDHKKIMIEGPISELEIKYTTSAHLEGGSKKLFLLDLSSVNSESLSVLVKLPETATLKYSLDSEKPSILPKTSNVATDGKRIIVRWTKEDFVNSQAGLIIYTMPSNTSASLYFLLISIFLILIATWTFFIINKRRKSDEKQSEQKQNAQEKSDLTKNLFEEEKAIVEVLHAEKTGELWQKQLEIKTGLNKVKLSRKLRSLEQKGVVERIPYGNTNKVRLKTNSF